MANKGNVVVIFIELEVEEEKEEDSLLIRSSVVAIYSIGGR